MSEYITQMALAAAGGREFRAAKGLHALVPGSMGVMAGSRSLCQQLCDVQGTAVSRHAAHKAY